MNNKTIKLMTALALCGALSGTAMAAPKGNPPPKGRPAATMKTPATPMATKATHKPTHHAAKATAHGKTHHAEPARRGHHAPPHATHRNPPPPPPKHHHHHGETLHTDDWCEVGATLIGGLIGGLIGAAL